MGGCPKGPILVERGCEEDELTLEILAGANKGYESSTLGSAGHGTPSIRLRRHLGRFLKPCPGTRRYICCGYWVLNLVLGCPYGCNYCILQDYLEDREIQVLVNVGDALREVEAAVIEHSGVLRVGTGELGDSLALEPLVPLSAHLVPFFARIPNAVLELKTKSCQVERLLELPHGGHTVVSFSLNPPLVAGLAEPKVPSSWERIQAARRCQERGYPIGIHLDPLVMVEGWQEAYRELLQDVFRELDPGGILWVSMGALRYPSSLYQKLVEVGLGLGEMVLGLDGKRRYLRPLRAAMFRTVGAWVREMAGEGPLLYLCMESPEVWEEALGFAPKSAVHLDALFQKRIANYWRCHR